MSYKAFRGSGVALVTPFTAKGEVDFNALGRLIDYCIDGGIQYLVALGTTGESVNLSKEVLRKSSHIGFYRRANHG